MVGIKFDRERRKGVVADDLVGKSCHNIAQNRRFCDQERTRSNLDEMTPFVQLCWIMFGNCKYREERKGKMILYMC